MQSLKSFLGSKSFVDTNLFGHMFTLEQLIARLLTHLYDATQAREQLRRLARQGRAHIDEVHVIALDRGDAGVVFAQLREAPFELGWGAGHGTTECEHGREHAPGSAILKADGL